MTRNVRKPTPNTNLFHRERDRTETIIGSPFKNHPTRSRAIEKRSYSRIPRLFLLDVII